MIYGSVFSLPFFFAFFLFEGNNNGKRGATRWLSAARERERERWREREREGAAVITIERERVL